MTESLLVTPVKFRGPDPLTAEEALDFPVDDLVEIEGELFHKDNLFECDGYNCYKKALHRADFNDDGLCDSCAEEAYEEAEHQRQLAADFRWSR
jgi:hypothetical protein